MATTTRKGKMAPQDDEVVEGEFPEVEPQVEDVPVPTPPLSDEDAPFGLDGPSEAQIEAWKAQYGDIYVTSFGPTEHYIWRTLTRHEYRRLVKQLEQFVAAGQVTQAEANMNNEEAICELCLLWPQRNRVDMGGDMAGVASIVSQEILEASAFVALEVRQL